MVRLSTLANVATVLGTGIIVWGIVSKFLARIRRRWVREWLTTSESLMISLVVAAGAMGVVWILILTISNHTLILQHSQLLNSFNSAVTAVLKVGNTIERLLRSLGAKT